MSIDEILCFAAGSMILTVDGERPVENLNVGDVLMTQNAEETVVRWISSIRVDVDHIAEFPNLRPVVMNAGCLATGIPSQDLCLSRQHRVMLESIVAERLFGQSNVLVPAHILAEFGYAEIKEDFAPVVFYHVLTDQHDVLVANQSPCESLFIGSQLKETIGAESYDQVCALVDAGIVSDKSNHMILDNKQARKLLTRIAKNNKPLLENTKIQSSQAA